METLEEIRVRVQITEKERREHYKRAAELRPELGTWHIITNEAVKIQEDGTVQWESHPIEDRDHRRGKWGEMTPPITSYQAMYIGYRFKYNGTWESSMSYEDPADEYDYFSQSKTVEVWMFVTHANRNPIAVFPFETPTDADKEQA